MDNKSAFAGLKKIARGKSLNRYDSGRKHFEILYVKPVNRALLISTNHPFAGSGKSDNDLNIAKKIVGIMVQCQLAEAYPLPQQE